MRITLTTFGVAVALWAGSAIAQETQEPVIPPPGSDQQQGSDQQGANQKKSDQKQKGAESEYSKNKAGQSNDNQGTAAETEQPVKPKKGEATKKETSSGDQQGGKKKENAAGQETDKMTTGSTTKARTEITAKEKTVIKNKVVTKNVTRVERKSIDFNISVGVAVPRSVHLVALPAVVVEVVPQYRGYLYFVLDDGTLVIVDPDTLDIVDIIA